jgi:hypothetical protein
VNAIRYRKERTMTPVKSIDSQTAELTRVNAEAGVAIQRKFTPAL